MSCRVKLHEGLNNISDTARSPLNAYYMSSLRFSTPRVFLVTMVAPLFPDTALSTANSASFSAFLAAVNCLALSMSPSRMFMATNMIKPWTPNSTLHFVGILRSQARRS
mmetsp:Transcript_1281/g.2999  ORF Transcript_1281/g.2999 Transcript_1281/m.2999 type:complete len:109 (-) Transcript_1281:224-550(-)